MLDCTQQEVSLRKWWRLVRRESTEKVSGWSLHLGLVPRKKPPDSFVNAVKVNDAYAVRLQKVNWEKNLNFEVEF